MESQRGPLSFATKLKILSQHSDGLSLADIATENEANQSVIVGVLDQKAQLERPSTRNKERQHLQLADKLLIIHMRSRGVTKKSIKDQLKISYRTIGRIEAIKDRLLSMDNINVRLSLQRCTARNILKLKNVSLNLFPSLALKNCPFQ